MRHSPTPSDRARSRATVPILSLLAISLSVTYPGGALAEPEARMILGTCVEVDMTPSEGVRVTFFPDSTTAITDVDGDFVLDWSGEAGFVQLERVERGAACRRVAIWAAESGEDLDVGYLRSPRGATSRSVGLQPGVAPPDTIRGSAPPTETNRFWFAMAATFDLWGNLLDFEQRSGDESIPENLIAAAAAWADTAAWEFRRESSCEDPPFEAILPVAYYWSPAEGVWIRDPDNRPRPR